MANNDTNDLYRIGTVASVTGIAVERLRAWERRYGLTPAHRAGKTRYYDAEQLARLHKIKALIDQGNTISNVIDLDSHELDVRLERSVPPPSNEGPAKSTTVGLIGPNLLLLERSKGMPEDSAKEHIDVRGRWANADAFMTEIDTDPEFAVLVVQVGVLLVHEIERLLDYQPNGHIVALYQFATPEQVAATQELGIPTLPWPAPWSDIERACMVLAGKPLGNVSGVTRRFSDDQLIAIGASLADPTGCTRHLVELITQLNAFAQYTITCQPSNDDELEAPPLFHQLNNETQQARVHLEQALAELVDAQNQLPLPRSNQPVQKVLEKTKLRLT